MKWFLYAISLFWISIGSCSILYTAETKKFAKNIFNHTDQKIVSTLPFILGVLFILSASATRFPWLFRTLGIIAVVEGIIYFLISQDLYERFMDWKLNSLSDRTYRLSGILGIIISIVILSLIL
jgi:uncharacterized protein YjeT (DUF2065 family)